MWVLMWSWRWQFRLNRFPHSPQENGLSTSDSNPKCRGVQATCDESALAIILLSKGARRLGDVPLPAFGDTFGRPSTSSNPFSGVFSLDELDVPSTLIRFAGRIKWLLSKDCDFLSIWGESLDAFELFCALNVGTFISI